ncbi:MAG TPA: hypothetical protein VM759_06055, partial [Longimicrobium sp.]|nr:hypothetical protein [Longimicrobium sp.]
FAASTAVSGVLNGLMGPDARVRGIARLLTDPAAWLRSPDALGAEGGGLDPARVAALLEAVGTALGMPAEGGLHLPGGLVLRAEEGDPLTLRLGGILPLGGEDEALELGLSFAIDRALAVTPAGEATVRVALPGLWTDVAITLGADAAGLALSATPGVGSRIDLLPRFGGFGALAEGAAPLLPAVLQAVVDARAPDPLASTGMLRAALELAEALAVYGFDAAGFQAPDRAERLLGMIRPGWLREEADGAAVLAALGAFFADRPGQPPLVDLPGTVTADGAALRWSLGAGDGQVIARLGWTESGPALVLGVEALALGPVTVDALEAGYDGGITFDARLRLEPGDGVLSFLRPALEAGVSGGRFALALHPLGAGTGGMLAVRIAPTPEVVLGDGGALALAERWGLPLAATLLLREFGETLEARLWSGGPTLRAVLDGSGLLQPGAEPPVPAPVLPPPSSIALGALWAAARAAAGTVRLQVSDGLWLSLVPDGSRFGVRLEGRQALGGEVGIRFGGNGSEGEGVTLWLLDEGATHPISPALEVAGLGVELAGAGGTPLLDGPFEIGRGAGFLFVRADFRDDDGSAALRVDGLGAGVEVRDARIRISAKDADGFLKNVLPAEMAAPFDLGVTWRDGRLALHGGIPGDGIELVYPLELDLPVIRLTELFLALRTRDGAAVVDAGVSGGAALGPVRAAVQRVG